MPRAIDIIRMVVPKQALSLRKKEAFDNYCLAFERGDALLKAHDITTPRTCRSDMPGR